MNAVPGIIYIAGGEQRTVRAVQEGDAWLVFDELGEDRRLVERCEDDGAAEALARDYAEQSECAGHPLVGDLSQ